MFDHVTLRASDRAATERLYDAVLPALGVIEAHRGPHSTLYGNFELSIAQATQERPATQHLHVGLRATDRAAVDAFWQAGVDAGFSSDGEPGPRPQYADDYYGAFLLDPDGNSIEACAHAHLRERGLIDHLWLRAADLPAQGGFLRHLAAHAGLQVVADDPTLLRVRGPRGGSLTLVADDGEATTGVHIAAPAAPAAIDAWHAAALAQGYADDGPPGPRPYHPQYYGAFIRDPAGISYELVDHGGLLGERG